MKNYVIIMICAFFLPTAGRAQINLVLNPSFEDYSNCPDNIDEAKYCKHWSSLDTAWNPPDWIHALPGIPEYDNSCATNLDVTVPSNSFFYQFARSGNGMMQVQMFSDDTPHINVRDYLQGHLAQTLTAGHKYSVCFYTSLEEVGGYAVNNIGAYLDNGNIDTTHYPGHVQNQYTPQILDTAIIADTLNWVKIEDTFTANGTEKLITIGQYSDFSHTHHVTVPFGTATGWAWYLIDDVSVLDCANEPNAGNDTVIHPGDSAFIGTHEGLLPYTWYKLGSAAPIDSGGGFWAHPAATTSYVLEQKLCGITKMDTVKIWVWPDTPYTAVAFSYLTASAIELHPNPTTGMFTIEGAKHCTASMFNIVGQEVWRGKFETENEAINIEKFPAGVYFVHITNPTTGAKTTSRIVKQ